jgi:hypothetical protein
VLALTTGGGGAVTAGGAQPSAIADARKQLDQHGRHATEAMVQSARDPVNRSRARV